MSASDAPATDLATSVKRPIAAVVLLGILTGLVQNEINLGPVISISVGKDLGMSPAILSFVTGLVPLALAATIIAAGSLADRLGRRRILVYGVLLVIVGDLVTMLAFNTAMYAGGRAITGFGAGAIYVCSFALVRAVAPTPNDLGRYIGLWVMVLYLALLPAQILSSGLGGLQWRLAFLTGIVCFLATLFFIPRLLPETTGIKEHAFDTLGLLVLGVGMFGLLFGISQMSQSLTSITSLGPLLVGLGLLVAFYFIERGRDNRAFPVEVLKNRFFVAAVIAGIGFNAFESIFLAQTSMLWQYLYRFEPLAVTLGQLPVAVSVIVSATFFGNLLTRGRSIRSVLVLGLVLMSVAFLVLTFTPFKASIVIFLVGGVLIGLGTSAAQTAQAKLFMDESPPEYFSATLASRTSVGQLGYSLGIAFGSSLLIIAFQNSVSRQLAESSLDPQQYEGVYATIRDFARDGVSPTDPVQLSALNQAEVLFTDGYRLVMAVSLVLALLTTLAVAGLLRKRSADPATERVAQPS